MLILFPALMSAQEHIWAGTRCKATGVTMTEFLPEGEPEAAVIICPGGSYHWLDFDAEGVKVAQWLRDNNIAAYVLRYRVAGKFEFIAKYRAVFRGHRHPDPLCDLQRAIQLVRERYDGPVGVMGFSAGGHLVMSSGEFFSTNFLSRYGIEPEVSLRPDFVVPVYPVVSMQDSIAHQRSRRNLLTRHYTKELQDQYSLELQIPADMPPTFLVTAIDDPVVMYQNSVNLDRALSAQHVPHVFLLYNTGGHGYGMDESKAPEAAQWRFKFVEWLHEINILP